jgi:hypothetical protein
MPEDPAAAVRFHGGVRRMIRGAAGMLVAEAMLLVSYHWTRGGAQDLVSAAILVWGAWETTRGYRIARGAAAGKNAASFRRARTILLVGIAVAGSLGYWLWYLGQYQRARLVARWEMNARTLDTFDAIETRMFARLDKAGTDDEWLETWREFASDLAAFRPSFEDALATGNRLTGLLRRESRRREMRDSLALVNLYLEEVEIYTEIEALFAAGAPGTWPVGLRERVDALYDVLQRIRSIQDSGSENLAGDGWRSTAIPGAV